jgi:hypothetical protein
LTARRAFEGSTVTATLNAVLHSVPDWSLLPRAVPGTLVILLRKCLEKEVSRRAGDIGAIRADLASIERGGGQATRWLKWGAGAVLASAVLAGAVRLSIYLQSGKPPVESAPLQGSQRQQTDETVDSEQAALDEARNAEALARQGPTSEALLRASRDELISVLEERARRIRAWIATTQKLARVRSKSIDPETLSRFEQEFNALHSRHIAALREGQMVTANELATDIVHLLYLVRDSVDRGVSLARDFLGVPQSVPGNRPTIRAPVDLYPVPAVNPRIDEARLRRIAARIQGPQK